MLSFFSVFETNGKPLKKFEPLDLDPLCSKLYKNDGANLLHTSAVTTAGKLNNASVVASTNYIKKIVCTCICICDITRIQIKIHVKNINIIP